MRNQEIPTSKEPNPIENVASNEGLNSGGVHDLQFKGNNMNVETDTGFANRTTDQVLQDMVAKDKISDKQMLRKSFHVEAEGENRKISGDGMIPMFSTSLIDNKSVEEKMTEKGRYIIRWKRRARTPLSQGYAEVQIRSSPKKISSTTVFDAKLEVNGTLTIKKSKTSSGEVLNELDMAEAAM